VSFDFAAVRRAQAARKAALAGALLHPPDERDTERKGEPGETKPPSFDGGARRTPVQPLTEGQVYAALRQGARARYSLAGSGQPNRYP
jgi:hypothetical protein